MIGASVYWTLDRVAGNTVAPKLRALTRGQFLDRAKILEFQSEALAQVVRHAAGTVPFYGRLFADHGIRATSIRSLDDLRRLPILTKKDLADHFEDHLSVPARRKRLVRRRTGGTTGIPVNVVVDRHGNGWELASYWRGCGWAGYRPGVPVAKIFGGSLGLVSTKRRHVLKRHLLRELHLPVFELTRSRAREFARRIEAHGAQVLIGYASALVRLGEYLNEEGVTLRVPIVLPKAERVDAGTRAALEHHFCGRVFDAYGSGEVTGVAHECDRHAGMHVSEDVYIVEVLDDALRNPVPSGRMVVTTLRNSAMPLLRYANDDLATVDAAPCACGRHFLRLVDLLGRRNDELIRSDGSRVAPVFAPHLFQKIPEIRRGQIVQPEIDRLVVRLTLQLGADRESVAERVRAAVRSTLGAVHVDFEFLPDILGSGDQKFRAQVCLLGGGSRS